MEIFPKNSYSFKIIGEETETLERLKRRTEYAKSLTSQITNKSFRGIIKDNTFRIIPSEIGSGAFCILTGEIKSKNGQVKVEINKPFRVLLSIILCFPIIALITQIISDKEQFSILLIIVAILQLLMIRYSFIELAFRILSKRSLNKLGDVLDIEHIEKN